MAPTIGYWDFRGRAEPLRLLLTYAGVEFTDKRYKHGPDSEWWTDKPKLGFDFPNIPYLIDGDVKLTQTLAILRYLGRKHKLEGSTEQLKNLVALVESQVSDNFTVFAQFLYRKTPATEEEKVAFVKNVEGHLEALSKYLKEKKFAVGSEVTYVDFWLYEYLKAAENQEAVSSVVGKFPNLVQYLRRVEALPTLAAYLKKINTK